MSFYQSIQVGQNAQLLIALPPIGTSEALKLSASRTATHDLCASLSLQLAQTYHLMAVDFLHGGQVLNCERQGTHCHAVVMRSPVRGHPAMATLKSVRPDCHTPCDSDSSTFRALPSFGSLLSASCLSACHSPARESSS